MQKLSIRFFDILLSLTGIVVLFPLMLVIAIFVLADSKGGAFFRQSRVGKDGNDFRLLKFRTMYADAAQREYLTVGTRDVRITPVGLRLRKYKLDELPQLLNVLKGEMSIVGPRPEVRKYVDLYNEEQRKILTVKPGITDYASIEYANENERLAASSDPVKTYIEVIMPQKIMLNMKFIANPTVPRYFSIILKTIAALFR